jgi:hypothetical protein
MTRYVSCPEPDRVCDDDGGNDETTDQTRGRQTDHAHILEVSLDSDGPFIDASLRLSIGIQDAAAKNARQAQPIRNPRPPIGVTAPNAVVPVSTSA